MLVPEWNSILYQNVVLSQATKEKSVQNECKRFPFCISSDFICLLSNQFLNFLGIVSWKSNDYCKYNMVFMVLKLMGSNRSDSVTKLPKLIFQRFSCIVRTGSFVKYFRKFKYVIPCICSNCSALMQPIIQSYLKDILPQVLLVFEVYWNINCNLTEYNLELAELL